MIIDGSISTLVSLDYEEQSVYNLTVMAMDLGTPALNTTMAITVTVTDVYDTAPNFTQKLYNRTLDVNTPESTVILTLMAGKYDIRYEIEGKISG